MLRWRFRSQPLIRPQLDKRPVQQTAPGSSVVFRSTLTWRPQRPRSLRTDPDAVALSNTSTVTVTLGEYGNAVLLTRKLGLFSISDVDPAAADIIGSWSTR